MAEINVTPFVDVMLVLLIVFMVAAPLLTVGVPVNLPETAARPLAEDQEPLQVTIDQKGAIFLEETEITLAQLVPRLRAISQTKTDA
ncbi:MAG: biopolymer transporter ExbD, partial [Sphingomonadales bacterium]|nr:biopolymer transporter ExbD [Sphingomonadales bacterium]